MKNPRNALAIVLALLAAISLTVVITHDDADRHTSVTVTLGEPQGDLAADANGQQAKPAESDLRDETPAGVNPAVADNPAEQGETKQGLVPKQPAGGAQNYSCRQDFSGQVYSSRNGARPRELHLHYTVSPNVAGWGDVLGVQGYFKRTRVGSATRIVDFEGRCLQMAPESAKPWTQGAFNPISISWEIIATGRETRAQWLAAPLIRDGILAQQMIDAARRHGIPLRFVDPVGCNSPAGWTDHNHLECGNNHTDVAPNFPFDVLKRQLATRPEALVPVRWHGRCKRLTSTRAKIARHEHVSAAERRKAHELRAVLVKGGYRCSGSRAVRR